MASKKAKFLANMEASLDKMFRGNATVGYKTPAGKRKKFPVRVKRGDNMLDIACDFEGKLKHAGGGRAKDKVTSVRRGRSKLYLARSIAEEK